MGRRSSTPPPSTREAERHTCTTTATQTEQTQDGVPAAATGVAGEDDMLCTERGVEEMVTMMEEDLGDHTCPALRLVLADEGTVCARIFRWALARLVGWDGKGGRKGLATEIKSRVPGTVLLVLMRMVEAELAVAKGGAAPDAKNRRLTLERRSSGASGKEKRRVSFSTFDLSTIDTPDLTKRGSTSPMDKVLSSLLLVLKAAEAVRNSLIPSSSEALPTTGSRGKENIPSHDGPHDHTTPLSATGSKPQQTYAPRTVIEKLVKLLADLQAACQASAATMDTPTGLGGGLVSGLLGRAVNWTEISNAAGLYAHELRVLLLEKDPVPSTCHTPGPQASRLLGRYHEVLSSLLRHELKRLLNMCTCGGEEEGVHAGQQGPAAFGQSADAMHRCCSCLVILAETGNLQYNSDDPAALLHFALERIHAHKGAWEALVNAAMESSSALASQQQHLSQDPRVETDVVCHTEAKEAHGDEEDVSCRPPRAKAQFSFRKKSWHESRADPDDEEDEEPKWCAVAREWGRDALCYLGAVSFLLRVMHEPVVENAVTAGRWARVEYLAKMLSSNVGPKVRVMPGDEGLGALWDVELLIESLEEDLKTAEEIRETLQATIPEGMAEGLGPGHYSGGQRMPSHIRRKRKRRAKSLEGPLTEILVWARFDQAPPALCFPCLIPGCVYAEPSMVAAYEEDMSMRIMQQQQQQEGQACVCADGAVVGGAGEGSEL